MKSPSVAPTLGKVSSALAEVVSALTQFVQQPRIFNGDDGLSGEVVDQFDLLVGERPNPLSKNDESADKLVLLEQGHGDESSSASEFDGGDAQWLALPVTSLCGDVENMDRLPGLKGTPRPFSNSADWLARKILGIRRWHAE